MFKLILKGQSQHIWSIDLLQNIFVSQFCWLEKTVLVAVLLPFSSVLLILTSWINEGLHTLLIQRWWFLQVTDVQGYLLLFWSVFYTKKVPADVSSSIGINSEEKIELSGLYLDNAIKISWLKSSIEDKLILAVESWIHPLKGSIEEGGFVVGFLGLRNRFTCTPMIGLTIFCRLTLYCCGYVQGCFLSTTSWLFPLPYFLWKTKVEWGLGPR